MPDRRHRETEGFICGMKLYRHPAFRVPLGIVIDHLQGQQVVLGPVPSRKILRGLAEVKQVPNVVPWRRDCFGGLETGPANGHHPQPRLTGRSRVGGLRFAPDCLDVGHGRHQFGVAAREAVLKGDYAPSRRAQPEQERTRRGENILGGHGNRPRPSDAPACARPRRHRRLEQCKPCLHCPQRLLFG